MSTTSAAASVTTRPAGQVGPLFLSEVARVWHRRLYRLLALLLLAGIVVVSVIAFVNHHKSGAGWTAYSVTDGVPSWYYVATENLPVVAISVTVALTLLAFVVGASVGGADWSSRSMALQLLWEPRRLRLLLLKLSGVFVNVVALGVVALALGLALGVFTAWMRGTMNGMNAHEWQHILSLSLRGLVLAVIVATIGYAIALLVRNTGAALGTGFVYFAIIENVIGITLMKFGPYRFFLSTNVAAWMSPRGVEVPGGQTTNAQGFTELRMVHLSSVHGLAVLLVYALVVGIPAIWSFTRRDVA